MVFTGKLSCSESLEMKLSHATAIFDKMIKTTEIRWGNQVLYKHHGRITTVACTPAHFVLMDGAEAASFFPIVLKAELLLQHGFIENKKYPNYPQSREFRLALPIKGTARHELLAYVRSNGECLAWAVADMIVVCNPVYHLHQLQNLHFALTGVEL
jgi:hypothetical protein